MSPNLHFFAHFFTNLIKFLDKFTFLCYNTVNKNEEIPS